MRLICCRATSSRYRRALNIKFSRPEQAARGFEALCELRPESPAAIEEGIMHNTLALFSLPPVSVW